MLSCPFFFPGASDLIGYVYWPQNVHFHVVVIDLPCPMCKDIYRLKVISFCAVILLEHFKLYDGIVVSPELIVVSPAGI